jgi:hypothetical protein
MLIRNWKIHQIQSWKDVQVTGKNLEIIKRVIENRGIYGS